MNNLIKFPKKKKQPEVWTHICPGIGFISAPASMFKCKCGATKNDRNQDGAA